MQNTVKKSSYRYKLNHFKIDSLEKYRKVLFLYKIVTNNTN